MEYENDPNYSEGIDSSSSNDCHKTFAILSYKGGRIYNHIENFSEYQKEANILEQSVSTHKINKNWPSIIDINSMTKNKNFKEIVDLALKSIFGVDNSDSLQMGDNKDSSNEDRKDSSLFSDEENIYNEFSERKRFQKLTHNQLIFLKQIIEKADITSKEISCHYKISPSQISKIKRTNIDQIQWGPRRNYTKLSSRENKLLSKTIVSYHSNICTPFTAKDVVEYVENKINKRYPIHFIQRFMKLNWGLTDKKVNSRPIDIDFQRLKAVRLLFVVEFCKLITPKTLIINIDESSINRHIKKTIVGA